MLLGISVLELERFVLVWHSCALEGVLSHSFLETLNRSACP